MVAAALCVILIAPVQPTTTVDGAPAVGPPPEVAPEDVYEESEPATSPEPPEPVSLGPHLVVANDYGVTAGVSPIPSFDLRLFVGRGLPAREPATRRTALGYSLTISVGYAERFSYGFVTARHHFTASFYGGRRERLFAAIGGGGAFFRGFLPAVIEVEGRLGRIFGHPRERRAVGVVCYVAR